MATCKDCLHVDVCEAYRVIGNCEIAEGCKNFKNRDKYVEQKHGHWQVVYKSNVWGEPTRTLQCSRCKEYTVNSRMIIERSDYCPNCGAVLDEMWNVEYKIC